MAEAERTVHLIGYSVYDLIGLSAIVLEGTLAEKNTWKMEEEIGVPGKEMEVYI